MFARRLALLASTAFVLSAGLVQAQSLTPNTAALSVSGENLIGNAFSAAPAAAASNSSSGGTVISPRVFAGILSGGGTGFLVGGGVSALVTPDHHHEVQGNVAYSRNNGVNSFIIDANYAYNFINALGDWTPYAGGGLNINHSSVSVCDGLGNCASGGGSNSGLQIGGGVKQNNFFGELWVILDNGNAVMIRAGLKF
ncbi:MAG: hypothetical protein LBQ09_04170 [Acidobacteriaceae bacterium]|jgi:hypothetical protein|nr:hypothetical protein [Acidobacteriaceae bacterium]